MHPAPFKAADARLLLVAANDHPISVLLPAPSPHARVLVGLRSPVRSRLLGVIGR